MKNRALVFASTLALIAFAATPLMSYAADQQAKAGSCCEAKAACCEAGAACCGEGVKKQKTEAKEDKTSGSCCAPGAPCCESGGACCG